MLIKVSAHRHYRCAPVVTMRIGAPSSALRRLPQQGERTAPVAYATWHGVATVQRIVDAVTVHNTLVLL